MVFGQSFGMVAIGMMVGLATAYAVSKALPSLMYGVRELAPPTVSISVIVLGVVALVAVGVSAVRAADRSDCGSPSRINW
jgi:ABC-type antimicrobial peptide transport system permease subunit